MRFSFTMEDVFDAGDDEGTEHTASATFSTDGMLTEVLQEFVHFLQASGFGYVDALTAHCGDIDRRVC